MFCQLWRSQKKVKSLLNEKNVVNRSASVWMWTECEQKQNKWNWTFCKNVNVLCVVKVCLLFDFGWNCCWSAGAFRNVPAVRSSAHQRRRSSSVSQLHGALRMSFNLIPRVGQRRWVKHEDDNATTMTASNTATISDWCWTMVIKSGLIANIQNYSTRTLFVKF